MNEHEKEHREAEHKASALYNVGWATGAGATIWARAVRDQLALHESARERFTANTADMEAWERLHGSALMLVVAIDQVLAFEQRVSRLAGTDTELAQARERFDAAVPGAEMLRDLVAHLDAYAVGEGFRQTGKRLPPLSEQYPQTFIYWGDDEDTVVDLGDQRLYLRTAAKAATDLAYAVERARARHQELAAQEADAAARGRFGIPPE